MPESSTSSSLQLSGPVYDQLKRVTTVVLPGLSALYFSLAQIWGLPAAEQVVGTIAALNLFLGLLVSLSSKSFNSDNNTVAGAINIENDPDTGKKLYTLELAKGMGPEDLDGKNEVRFKIHSS